MALDRFKNIDEVVNKGTSLTTELNPIDLELINQGFKATPFNIGVNDVLEFALYDASNNLLEQKDYGSIRYIKGEEISEYLIQSENLLDKVLDGGGFLVDVKRLIKDAGYNTGIFRVQLNFVNDRVGSSVSRDKMWIHEISPTRLELRLLPFDNFDESSNVDIDTKIDLNQAYNNFVIGKFSGDEVYSEIDGILNRLTPSDLFQTFKKIKSETYINQLAAEFGVQSFEIFFSKVLETMKIAVRHALLHRNSTIGSNQFGKSLGDDVDFTYYNKSDIIRLLNTKFEDSVQYHLPKRTLSEEVLLDNLTQQSIDKLQDLVQTLKSDVTQTNPQAQKFVLEPPTLQEVKDNFTVQKQVLPNPSNPEVPIVIEVPVIKAVEPIVTPPSVAVPVNYDDADQQRERLARLQQEMMYQQQQQTAPAYTAGYSNPTQVEGAGSGGGRIQANENPVLINEPIFNDVITQRKNYENIL